jgi:uncharacterized protein with NRDE domain
MFYRAHPSLAMPYVGSSLDHGKPVRYANLMCTVITLIRPGHQWPLIMAANRDEMRDRPSKPPAHHWQDRDHVVAGLDVLAGGTWLGMNEHGLVACILNRVDSLGPMAGKRSRGELPLEALDHAEARTATEALVDLDPQAYRSFNMVIADIHEAWWIASSDVTGEIGATRMDTGISMVTAHDMNDPTSERISHHLPRFRAAPVPDPGEADWFAWEALMADRSKAEKSGWSGAMCIDGETGFGTVSSSLIALPAVPDTGPRPAPIWRFAPGIPGETKYFDVMM